MLAGVALLDLGRYIHDTNVLDELLICHSSHDLYYYRTIYLRLALPAQSTTNHISQIQQSRLCVCKDRCSSGLYLSS